MKRMFVFFGILSLFLFAYSAEWVGITGTDAHSIPSIVSHSDNSTVIHVTVDGFYMEKADNGDIILSFDKGQAFADDEGKPAVPMFRRNIAIPDKGQPVIKIKNVRTMEFDGLNDLIPVQPPVFETQSFKEVYVKDEAFYAQDEYFPQNRVEIEHIGNVRSFRFATLCIYPMFYNPATGKAEIAYDFDIEITYQGTGEYELDRIIPVSDRWIPIYEQMFMNWEWVKDSKPDAGIALSKAAKDWDPDTWFDEGDYLILVVSDEMAEKVKELAAWKTKLGYRPVIKQVPNSISTTALRDTILYCYNNWSIPPEFVCIVGEGEENEVTNHIEAHNWDASSIYSYGVEAGRVRNDHFFSLMPNDADWHSDLFVSRIPARDSSELGVWIDKIKEYEGTPPAGNWFQSYFCIGAMESGRIFNYTAKQFALNLVNDGDFTDLDTLLENNYSNGVMGGHVVDSIDDGHNVLVFRGHGDEGSLFGFYGGADYGYDDMFMRADVPSMDAASMGMGFMFAPTCLANNFAYPNYESMGELMVNMDGKGITGYFGATNVSLSFYNDSMSLGISHAITGATTPEFQVISVYGKNYMETYSGSDTYFELEQYLMNEVGDPACRLWTKIPDTLFVQHDAAYPNGGTDITLYAYDQHNNPVANAIITVWDTTGVDSVYAVGTTDGTGYVTLPDVVFEDADEAGEIMISGSAKNHIPYFGNADVSADSPAKTNIISPFNDSRFSTLTPSLQFTTTDPQGDQVQYMVYWDDNPAFSNPDSSATGLYASGATASFTFPSALTDEAVYYWKAKAKDPSDSDKYGPYSNTGRFSVSTTELPLSSVSWYQTSAIQFGNCAMNSVQISGDSIILVSGAGYSVDTTYHEDFEGGSLPAGWSITNGDGDSYTWYVTTTSKTDLGGYEPPSAGSYYAYYSDDDAGSGNSTSEEYLYSAAIPMPSADSVFVSFGFGFRQYGSTVLTIQYRLFNSSWGSWLTAGTINTDGSGTGTIDFTDAIADSVQLLFLFDDGASWGWAAAVDNVCMITKTQISNTHGDITGSAAYFNNLAALDSRTDWGYIKWYKSDASDSIAVQVEYCNSGTWGLVPDGVITGNSSGIFTTNQIGAIDITSLSTSTYDSLRLVAHLYRSGTKASSDPALVAWEIGNRSSSTAIHLAYSSAIVNDGSITLNWTSVMPYDIDFVEINRTVDNSSSMIARVGPNSTSYTDNDVIGGKTYVYNIAITAGGQKIWLNPVRVKAVNTLMPGVHLTNNISVNGISIQYGVLSTENVEIGIYDLSGRKVRTIENGIIARGLYTYRFNNRNENGEILANGVYFIKYNAGSIKNTERFIIIR